MDTVWNSRFWLEEISTRVGDAQFFKDLLVYPILVAFLLLFLRLFVLKNLFYEVGKKFGIKDKKPKPVAPNGRLERVYLKNGVLDKSELRNLAKECDLKENEIERWWRQRRAYDKPSELDKFSESFWKFLFYTFNFIFGYLVMHNKPWFWDFDHEKRHFGLPQSMETEIYWYLAISMAFYWSVTFSHFFEAKRNDFWQMFAHHLVTLLLFILSIISYYHRLGCMINLLHDTADILLQAGKCARYAKNDKLTDKIFVVFITVWIVTRLGMLPRIIYFTLNDKIGESSIYYSCNALLIILLSMHIRWTIVIIQIALKSVKSGKGAEDIRSESEDND